MSDVTPHAADRVHLSWAQCAALSQALADAAAAAGRYDTLMAVSRGGLVPGALIATLLRTRDVVSTAIASYENESRTSAPRFFHFPEGEVIRGRRVLIVDDVWDTGHTAVAVADRVREAGGTPVVAVLHYKPGNSHFPGRQPDLWVEETAAWIVYPWEREALSLARDAAKAAAKNETPAGAATVATPEARC